MIVVIVTHLLMIVVTVKQLVMIVIVIRLLIVITVELLVIDTVRIPVIVMTLVIDTVNVPVMNIQEDLVVRIFLIVIQIIILAKLEVVLYLLLAVLTLLVAAANKSRLIPVMYHGIIVRIVKIMIPFNVIYKMIAHHHFKLVYTLIENTSNSRDKQPLAQKRKKKNYHLFSQQVVLRS
jgi:hypothetical protein